MHSVERMRVRVGSKTKCDKLTTRKNVLCIFIPLWLLFYLCTSPNEKDFPKDKKIHKNREFSNVSQIIDKAQREYLEITKKKRISKKRSSEALFHSQLVKLFDRHLADPFPFEYIIENESLCQRYQNLFVLHFYHTDSCSFSQRDSIRLSWGHHTWTLILDFKLVFILSYSEDSTCSERVIEEANLYRDIIFVDFKDFPKTHYASATVLTMSHWIHSHSCPSLKWVFFSKQGYIPDIFEYSR